MRLSRVAPLGGMRCQRRNVRTRGQRSDVDQGSLARPIFIATATTTTTAAANASQPLVMSPTRRQSEGR